MVVWINLWSFVTTRAFNKDWPNARMHRLIWVFVWHIYHFRFNPFDSEDRDRLFCKQCSSRCDGSQWAVLSVSILFAFQSLDFATTSFSIMLSIFVDQPLWKLWVSPNSKIEVFTEVFTPNPHGWKRYTKAFFFFFFFFFFLPQFMMGVSKGI